METSIGVHCALSVSVRDVVHLVHSVGLSYLCSLTVVELVQFGGVLKLGVGSPVSFPVVVVGNVSSSWFEGCWAEVFPTASTVNM